MKGLVTEAQGDLLGAGVGAAVNDCAAQVVQTVLMANRGELKEYPLIGGEIFKQLGGNRDRFWPQEVKKMIRACGVAVSTVDIDPDTDIVTVK